MRLACNLGISCFWLSKNPLLTAKMGRSVRLNTGFVSFVSYFLSFFGMGRPRDPAILKTGLDTERMSETDHPWCSVTIHVLGRPRCESFKKLGC